MTPTREPRTALDFAIIDAVADVRAERAAAASMNTAIGGGPRGFPSAAVADFWADAIRGSGSASAPAIDNPVIPRESIAAFWRDAMGEAVKEIGGGMKVKLASRVAGENQ